MSLPLAIIAMVLILAGFALYAMLAFRLYKRLRTALRQRGYKSPALLTGAAVAAFTLPFVCTLLMQRILGRDDDALWWLLLSFLAAPLVLTLAVRLLPARNPRTAGRRMVRFPYRPVGYFLLGGAAVLWTAALVTNKAGLFQVGVQFLLGGLGCLIIARRANAPDASAVLAVDPRPPVVYLRPFQHEDEIFAKLPWRFGDLGNNLGRVIMYRKSWHSLTLEQYLGMEISARIGPFVALGNPVDFVPPEGAARTYVADDEWTTHFDEMVRRARCIVLMAATSEHVLWELAQIRSMDLQQQLFVLTKPKLVRRTTAVSWGTFAAALQQAGYQPCGEDSEPGAVVGFDGMGQAVVLKRDARNAAETVDVLCNRLKLPVEATDDRRSSKRR